MKWMQIARASTIAAACALMAVPVGAKPGQTLAQFETWSAQRPLLRGVARTKDETSGWPAFDLSTADHGVAWHFHAATNGAIVRSEELGIASGPGDPGTTPISHAGTGYGFTFFRSFYGSEIARDFLAAPRIAVVADPQSHVTTTFYRGNRFGYEVSGGFVTIATLRVMAQDLAQMRTCIAHPGTCNE